MAGPGRPAGALWLTMPAMQFCLIDSVLERTPDRLVAVKNVSLAEEYLADHFPTFPVLPGVMMIEAMVQAARALMAGRWGDEGRPMTRLVLGEVRALKFGSFVRPGEALEVEVSLAKELENGCFQFKGSGRVRRMNQAGDGGQPDGETAVSGRFTLRPVRMGT